MTAGIVAQWSMLALYVLATLTRLPDAIRGVNRSIFIYFLMVSGAIALSLPTFYLPIDGLFGGQNVTNLMLRFLNFGACLVIGRRIAEAYDSPLAEKAIRGPAGWIAFGVIGGLMTVFFVLSDTLGSAAGLAGLRPQETLVIYSSLGYLFPAYVAVCLLGPVFSDVTWGDESGANKAASWLMLAGLAGVAVQPILYTACMAAPSLSLIQLLTAFFSLGLIGIALTVMWLANRKWFPAHKSEPDGIRPVLRLVGPIGSPAEELADS
ncbi:hypothetical protein SPF06_07185 [Sinomonas sp. JGH33]|uniref:Uncharacterized protein n=1 Tax=Sinomonas terricola TaxID=3110330 RepID=A0ABU5T4B0_9MICC|nr:hypothetical protein [Sinomonas sp. JGH33]MEA5454501.1 hypothetical protein [Sinomonas sp. JGH33]